ncbi:MAG TPA: DUF1289 domain-containing protein [Pseudolabrys sp.]|nr:DUF1289 domain-containing protein [Pseudolabrys sp.]
MTTIATPCVKVCTLDPASRQCLACGRTIDEIARWMLMTPEERARIMAELPARRGATPTPEAAIG